MAADAPAPAFRPATRSAGLLGCELRPGEGVVRRLPQPGMPCGTRLLLALDDGHQRELYATASKGFVVLARLLQQHQIMIGDRIQVACLGWRRTRDAQRRYRAFQVRVLERTPGYDGGVVT